MVLQIIVVYILLIACIFSCLTTQLIKYPRVLSVKPSNKVYNLHTTKRHGGVHSGRIFNLFLLNYVEVNSGGYLPSR